MQDLGFRVQIGSGAFWGLRQEKLLHPKPGEWFRAFKPSECLKTPPENSEGGQGVYV